MRVRCLTCRGEYDRILPDGQPYYHACPPVPAALATRGGVTGLITVSRLRPTDLVTVLRAGASLVVAVADVVPTDVRVGDVALPRPNARDENIGATTIVNGKIVGVPKADGAGVVPIPDVVFPGVPVLDVV